MGVLLIESVLLEWRSLGKLGMTALEKRNWPGRCHAELVEASRED